MEEVISDAKVGDVVVVQEAKIRFAEDLENAGSWDVDSWCEALAKLTSKPATTSQDLLSPRTKGDEMKDAADHDQGKVQACKKLG